MHYKYIPKSVGMLAFVLCVLLVADGIGHSQTNTASKGPPAYALEVPGYFPAVNAIKGYFDQQGVTVKIKELSGRTDAFCFVRAYPYSGVDTTDLYCFVKRDGEWLMFLKAFLWRASIDVEFKVDGDFVDVICRGVVVLKINPPK
jgi:hypothetical protein